MSTDYTKYCGPLSVQKAFSSLCGLLEGMDADKVINSRETQCLIKWFSENDNLKDRKPFDEIFSKFSEIIADGKIDKEEFQDLFWLCSKFKEEGVIYNQIIKDIQFLHGLVAGIASDNKINLKEIEVLRAWLDKKEYLKGTWPYDEFYSLCLSSLRDGVIDEEERANLIRYFKEFMNLNDNQLHLKIDTMAPLSGICAIDPVIEFDYKRFVITGKSTKVSQTKIKDLIEDWAGQVDQNVSDQTDYLIVMAEGNSAWTFSAFGRKVEEAVELRKKGHKIVIVHEGDLWDALRQKEVA